MNISIIIPTLDAGNLATNLIESLQDQTICVSEIIVIDSSSVDNTADTFRQAGACVQVIEPSQFHHAGTRNRGAHLASGDILVFLTQDALPNHLEWLENLIAPLSNGQAAASFARQVPYPSANPLERFARETNYPATSRLVTQDDVSRLGIRAFFFSNSCSAVRKDVFDALGGFPTHTIMNEDMLFAAKLLESGHKIAYCADACVQHSHSYSTLQTFRRYFDIGVVMDQAAADLSNVALKSEGARYVKALGRYLLENKHYSWLLPAGLESAAKFLGYRLGKQYRRLPRALVRRLSMHAGYWR